MNKIFNFLCTSKIGSNCNKIKLFITIFMVRFKEKLFILLGLIILLCIFYKLSLFYPNKLVDSINTILLSTFTTIFVIDIVNTFQKIQNINFELVKNIFIEKCWNIFVTLHIKKKPYN